MLLINCTIISRSFLTLPVLQIMLAVRWERERDGGRERETAVERERRR
jgi:hypothetical protein